MSHEKKINIKWRNPLLIPKPLRISANIYYWYVTFMQITSSLSEVRRWVLWSFTGALAGPWNSANIISAGAGHHHHEGLHVLMSHMKIKSQKKLASSACRLIKQCIAARWLRPEGWNAFISHPRRSLELHWPCLPTKQCNGCCQRLDDWWSR